MSRPFELSAEVLFYKRQYETLLDLSRSHAIDAGDLTTAFQEILVAASETLQCERVSIWLLDAKKDFIVCVKLYQQSTKSFSAGDILYARDYPDYFNYLNEERFLPARDATLEPATHEFAKRYLPMHGITSMLDAPIRLDGEMVGVLCHEHVGVMRGWSIVEQGFAGVVAEMVARAMQAEARQKAQNDLQAINENLARTVAEKTAHLETTLENCQDKLIKMQRLSREKNSMLGMVAHDLKNPLTAILNFAEFIEISTTEPKHQRYAALIQDLSKRMTNSIHDLLEGVAQETGQVKLRKRPIDIAQLTRLVVTMNEEQAKRKDQKIELQLDEDCLANVDEDRMCEVLDNLLSNAIKYSPKGKSITVSVKKLDKPNHVPQYLSSVVVAVTDEGQGLSDDDQANMFGAFQRLSAQPTGGETSNGLGLSIVKQLVELHDGKIWAQSDGKEKGSTFFVELPALTQKPDYVL
jgi:signal transduction histidine kinase